MLEALLVVGTIGVLLYLAIRALLSSQGSLDEHVIAESAVSGSDYDELLMTALATARQRKAIFETEE